MKKTGTPPRCYRASRCMARIPARMLSTRRVLKENRTSNHRESLVSKKRWSVLRIRSSTGCSLQPKDSESASARWSQALDSPPEDAISEHCSTVTFSWARPPAVPTRSIILADSMRPRRD